METVAFFSYTRADDASSDGLLSAMHKLLEKQVSTRLGDGVDIFKDTDDIKAGQKFRQRLDKALTEATYFIPVITPSFFNSGPCRYELKRFVKKVERVKRDGLIVPLHFIDSPVILDEASAAKDALAKVIEETQWIDLRDHNRKTEIDQKLREAVIDLAELLVERVRQDRLDPDRMARERKEALEALVEKDGEQQAEAAGDQPMAPAPTAVTAAADNKQPAKLLVDKKQQDGLDVDRTSRGEDEQRKPGEPASEEPDWNEPVKEPIEPGKHVPVGTTISAGADNKQAASNQRALIVGSAALIVGTLALVTALSWPWFTNLAAHWTDGFFKEPFPEGLKFRDCDECPEMVVIPGGSFVMGSPDTEAGRQSDEGPQREVRIEKMAIGRYEVTFDEWDACVADGFCRAVENDAGWGRGLRPAINVSWDDITGEDVPERGFLAWMNDKVQGTPYRLPSEAEWEYAARAGTTSAFAFGETITADQANFGGNFEGGRTSPVGTYPANAFGLYDMHGNVWEWVADCWHSTYDGAPADGSAWVKNGEGDCALTVLRGGSWSVGAQIIRSANRGNDGGVDSNNSFGFRLARTLPPN